MTLEELLSKALETDLDSWTAFLAAKAAVLRSISFHKVVDELIIPYLKAKMIPKEQHQQMIDQAHRIIHASASNTIAFNSVAVATVVHDKKDPDDPDEQTDA